MTEPTPTDENEQPEDPYPFLQPPPPPPIPDELTRPVDVRTPVSLPQGGSQSAMSGAGQAWGIAMDFVFTIIAGIAIGYGIDYLANSLPLWTLVGLGTGFVGAFVRIVRRTVREDRLEQQRRRPGSGGPREDIPHPRRR